MEFKCPHCNKVVDFPASQSRVDGDEKTGELDATPQFSVEDLFVNIAGLNLRSSPEVKEGNKITVLPLGTRLSVLEKHEKWYRVQTDDGNVGWVSCFYLSEYVTNSEGQKRSKIEEAKNLLPIFKIGVPNDADSDNAKKVRQIITGEFGMGRKKEPLQCTEYVHYKVQQLGVVIQWPADRPRHGGKWASIFKRNNCYRILSEPKAGCAMSFTRGLKDSNVGHVAFVEEVLDDGSIRISEANWPPPGKYFERLLSQPEWRDKYGGRFIQFT